MAQTMTGIENFPTIETDVLIIGSGPAGASLASFLGFLGVKGFFISSSVSTVKTPRAHYTNCAAMECLRDIGLEADAMRWGYPSRDISGHYRFSETMVSGEFARRPTFGSERQDPSARWDASPCEHLDLPQTKSEPLLVRFATQHGFSLRNEVEFISFKDQGDQVITLVKDNLLNQYFRIKSRFLCGADGARSKVMEQLSIPIDDIPGGGLAMNVGFECDLSHLMGNGKGPSYLHTPDCSGLLHGVFAPDKEQPPWAVACILRTIEPWKQWLAVLLAAPGVTEINANTEQVERRIRDFIGDETIAIKIGRTSVWAINDQVAQQNKVGNVFALGDAVHRHPPGNGLGSNTCIQDAYNLAWKMSYVLKGLAPRTLLDTYQVERIPVAKQIVARANETIKLHFTYYGMLGLLLPDPASRMVALRSIGENTHEAREKRKRLVKAQKDLDYERNAFGAEMNYVYDQSGAATYLEDETSGRPPFDKDYDLFYQQSTYPGFRLPHAWLGTQRMGEAVSTHDLAGKGRFTVFTGIGGDSWKDACKEVEQALPGIRIACFSIGWGQEYTDWYDSWFNKREIEDDGCVLVRPDRYIAWRCPELVSLGATAPSDKLLQVMKKILTY